MPGGGEGSVRLSGRSYSYFTRFGFGRQKGACIDVHSKETPNIRFNGTYL
jgi:hypothetical protein